MGSEPLRTPLFQEHLALGATMVEYAGYMLPVRYSGIIEEHLAVRSGVGAFDVSHMAALRVSGCDARQGLQAALTNDVASIDEIGRAQYTLLCRPDGGIVDDLIVYHTGDFEYLIVANAVNRQTVSATLGERLAQGTEISDETDRTALVAVQGPKALDALSKLAEEDWEPPRRFRISEGMFGGVPVLAARTGYAGEDGAELFCGASGAVRLWRALMSLPEVTPCGIGARDTLRLEMGYPLYGNDMDQTTSPVCAGLMWAVDMEKGEFVGRGSIESEQASGPARRLVGLEVEAGIPRPGMTVLRDGVAVGNVASGTYSPTLKRGIATAFVRPSAGETGTMLEVEMRRRTTPARVVERPFVHRTSLG